MLLPLHNRSGQAMLLSTEEADEALNITEIRRTKILRKRRLK